MSNTTKPSSMTIQAADLYITRVVGGVPGSTHLINGTDFTYTPATVEINEIKSTMKETYGQTLETYPGEVTPAELTLAFNFADPEIFALTFGATMDEVEVKEGSVVDGLFKTNKAGTYVNLGFDIIDESKDFEIKTDADTFVAGTDYSVDFYSGMVKILSEKLADAKDVKVSFSYLATKARVFRIGTELQAKVAIKFVGINAANGETVRCDIWDVTLTPTEAITFHGLEPINAVLKGKMATPRGKTEPFELRV